MVQYFVRRTARALVTVLGVVTLTFGLIRFLPGGPFTLLRIRLLRSGVPASEVDQQIANLQNIRPDAPIWQQYIDYLLGVFQGDLGQSISVVSGKPVADILAGAVPWTVFLVVVSTLAMFAIGLAIGSLQAYWEGTRFDKAMTGLDITFSSIPFFVYAVIFLFVFAYQLRWFPTAGHVGRNIENTLSLAFLISVAYHAVLPIAAYTIPSIGNQALGMRGNSIQILGEDYVRVARLRGLSDWRIATRYVSRNAVLPMYTGLLLLLGFRLGGTVILEIIFTYPGLGYYMIEAVEGNDYPLMMGCFLVITIALVIGVFIADLTYGKIDPRIQTGDSHEAY